MRLSGPMPAYAVAHSIRVPVVMSSRPVEKKTVRKAADLTKWAVSVAVATGLLLAHNAEGILYVSGGILNSSLTKVVKRAVNAPRPASSPQDKQLESSGMPSSHASALAYFAFALLLVSKSKHVVVAPVLAAVVSSWRVSAGYHTLTQVVVGYLFGALFARLWMTVAVPSLLPYVHASVSNKYGPWPLTFALGAAVSRLHSVQVASQRKHFVVELGMLLLSNYVLFARSLLKAC